MRVRYLGFLLLIWFPGAMRAKECQPPVLRDGYFVPEQDTYAHSAELTYACNRGFKPAVEGWWATSKCENGKWSHELQCIDQNACLPPNIPNRQNTDNQRDWYDTQTTIQVACENGYELKDESECTCINGSWSSLPVCKRTASSCSAPPKISNAVVINQGYREVFPAGSEVQYHCENGYTNMGQETIICEAGQWNTGPICNISSADRGHTASAGRNTQHAGKEKTGDGTGSQPVVEEVAREHVESDASRRQPSGGGGETTGHHRGSSATSDSNGRDSGPPLRPIQLCGSHPVVENAVVVDEGPMYLKYQCKSFYRRVGPETVTCYSDGSWSPLPTCEESFCVMDSDRYTHYNVQPGQREYMEEGATKLFQCVWRNYYIGVWCANRRITLSKCCHRNDVYSESCRRFTEPI